MLSRRFLPVVFGSLVYASLCGSLGYDESPKRISCDSSLSQARSGVIQPVVYLAEKARCSPEISAAKDSGIIIDVVYQPVEAGHGHVGTILPSTIETFGHHMPVYVVFNENLFSSETVQNDADVDSIIKHEKKHAEDWYNGIHLDGIDLSYDTISPSTMRIDFLEHLMELRAVHSELYDMFKQKVYDKKLFVSPSWFGSQAANYSSYWSFVENPTTDLERAVRDRQFIEFRDIVPNSSGDFITISFDLFGVHDSATVKRAGNQL